MLRVLLGFEVPELGTVRFDGQDLDERRPARAAPADRRRRRRTARLMPGDIFTNIVGARPLTDRGRVGGGRVAGIEDDIRALPMGMHTMVAGGRGAFSGGQRQRLLIARAVVGRPRILLFDEATSALDNQHAGEIVSSAIERLRATRIVIAHRLSTVRRADRILVLDAGRLVQEGSYAELVAADGLFRAARAAGSSHERRLDGAHQGAEARLCGRREPRHEAAAARSGCCSCRSRPSSCPPLYARDSPRLAGLPFFVWYQLVAVVFGGLVTGLVYVLANREPKRVIAAIKTEQALVVGAGFVLITLVGLLRRPLAQGRPLRPRRVGARRPALRRLPDLVPAGRQHLHDVLVHRRAGARLREGRGRLLRAAVPRDRLSGRVRADLPGSGCRP